MAQTSEQMMFEEKNDDDNKSSKLSNFFKSSKVKFMLLKEKLKDKKEQIKKKFTKNNNNDDIKQDIISINNNNNNNSNNNSTNNNSINGNEWIHVNNVRLDCHCGSKLKLLKCDTIYNGSNVFCDICGKRQINGDIYHCLNTNYDVHPHGFDICKSCYNIQKNNGFTKITLNKRQNNRNNINNNNININMDLNDEKNLENNDDNNELLTRDEQEKRDYQYALRLQREMNDDDISSDESINLSNNDSNSTNNTITNNNSNSNHSNNGLYPYMNYNRHSHHFQVQPQLITYHRPQRRTSEYQIRSPNSTSNFFSSWFTDNNSNNNNNNSNSNHIHIHRRRNTLYNNNNNNSNRSRYNRNDDRLERERLLLYLNALNREDNFHILLEHLNELNKSSIKGAKQYDIDNLPTNIYKETNNNNNNSNNDNKLNKCCICLDDFKNGDEIKRLPCFHIFHKNEIDKWLKQNHICPICRIPIDEQ